MKCCELCGKDGTLPQGYQTRYSKDVEFAGKDNRSGQAVSAGLKLILAGFVALGFMCGEGAAKAQSVLDKVPVEASTPPPTTSFFPLDQLHRGLQGVAYTVFEGTKPEPMGVEILGLLHNAIGPGEDMILGRLEGAKPEYSGVVAGMSGSPVYIDGKLVGAIAYRIGVFSKEPICGITPIEQMLQNRLPNTRLAARSAAAQSGKVEDAALNLPDSLKPGNLGSDSLRAEGEDIEASDLRPIDTPLVFSGFSPQAVALWRQHAPALGLTAVAGIGGVSGYGGVAGNGGLSGMANVAEQHSIEPGSAVSAVLVRGDLEISATCTVTYVDPTQLLACGHPITQFGPVSFPMTKASVVATLPSPYNAFKIINTGQMIGAFTEDRQTAIRGQFGLEAKMIPLTIHVNQDGNAGASRTLHLQVVDQEQLTPQAVLVSLYQGLMESNEYAVETTYRVRGTVQVKGYPPMRLNQMVAPSTFIPSNLAAALLVGERFQELYNNAARLSPVESIDIDVDALSGRRTMQLESAQAERNEVRGGDTVMIDAAVLPWRGEVRNVEIPVTLPATLPAGQVRLLVSGGEAVDRLMQPPVFGAPEQGVEATIAGLNSLHPSDRLYVTLLAPEAQATMDGQTMAGVPLSMANVLDPAQASRQVTLHGESAVPLGSVELGSVLDGEQLITLQVK